ncbi:glycosyltransferase [bacterium]|nr:glycosyltransferase [bacterium]
MSDRPNILMVSYFFPPAATGVRRVLSLCRYLPESDWRPIVLSVKPVAGEGRDAAPLADPRIAIVPVERTGSLDPFRLMHLWQSRRAPTSALGGKSSGRRQAVMDFLRRFVFFPDDRAGWVPFAVWRGVRLVRRNKLQAIYSSNYPQSAHLVAGLVSALTGVPWLADFRDGWTQNPAFHRPGNRLMAALQGWGERFVARRAQRIVTVSPPITRHLQGLRPSDREPATTIWNGMDTAETGGLGEAARPLNPGKTTLVYTGTFFGRRRPDLFLAALARVLKRDPSRADRLRVRMRCDLTPREREMAARGPLKEVVELLPPVPFRECLREQSRADTFLLILESGPGAEIMVSQKVFEYLAFRRPIFALVPEGAAAELLRDTGGATIAHPAPAGDVADALAQFLTRVEEGRHERPAEWVLERFNRRSQAHEIAQILDKMVDQAR